MLCDADYCLFTSRLDVHPTWSSRQALNDIVIHCAHVFLLLLQRIRMQKLVCTSSTSASPAFLTVGSFDFYFRYGPTRTVAPLKRPESGARPRVRSCNARVSGRSDLAHAHPRELKGSRGSKAGPNACWPLADLIAPETRGRRDACLASSHPGGRAFRCTGWCLLLGSSSGECGVSYGPPGEATDQPMASERPAKLVGIGTSAVVRPCRDGTCQVCCY
jgi:hypothetical protein